MTKLEQYENMPAIGVYSGMSGLELKEIEYGIEDYAHFISGILGGKRQHHRLKIYYDRESPYCKLNGCTVSFAEIMRVNWS